MKFKPALEVKTHPEPEICRCGEPVGSQDGADTDQFQQRTDANIHAAAGTPVHLRNDNEQAAMRI